MYTSIVTDSLIRTEWDQRDKRFRVLSEIELIHARLNVGWNPFTSYRMSHSWAKLQKTRQKLYLKNSGKLTILTYAFSSLTDFNEAHAITEILQMCLKKTCEIM